MPLVCQLIPGHEAIGRVVEMGKNVKDFAIGDRVVADVGISVGVMSQLNAPSYLPRLLLASATTASTADAASLCSARTSTRAE